MSNVSAVNNVADAYASYATSAVDTDSAAESTAAAVSEAAAEEEETAGAVYEKSDDTTESATYSINKMSAEDRAALVEQLKADEESRQNQLMDLVKKMLTEQATSYSKANDIWSFLAKGDYTVDEAAKLQAQEDISEDGYYGVEQTASRLFDFACALAGDDVDKLKEMQEAMQKGFAEATKSWGDELPSICQDTLDAANQKFEDYYASLTQATEE